MKQTLKQKWQQIAHRMPSVIVAQADWLIAKSSEPFKLESFID